MSVPCPHCHKALKVEDITVKNYLPVNDLQTCGRITITKTGRVVAKIIRSGDGIECEGALEAVIETDGEMLLGAKASWKGASLRSKSLNIADGAKLLGVVKVPWIRPEVELAKKAAKMTEVKDLEADGP